MSGKQAAADKNRKERRAKVNPSVKEQQLASLCVKVHDDGKIVRREGEPDADYFKRIRDKAQAILRNQRRVERRNKRAARKRNRR